MGSVSREMEILWRGKTRNARDKNIVTEIKNAFDELISRLNTAVEMSSELEVIYQLLLEASNQKQIQNKKQTKTNTCLEQSIQLLQFKRV